MTNAIAQPFTWRSFSVGSALVLALTISGSATAGQKLDKDRDTCAAMGAPYGSPSYTGCMLQQQQRRDQKMSNFLDQQLMHQELGRPAREKLAEKRERRAREKEHERQRDAPNLQGQFRP